MRCMISELLTIKALKNYDRNMGNFNRIERRKNVHRIEQNQTNLRPVDCFLTYTFTYKHICVHINERCTYKDIVSNFVQHAVLFFFSFFFSI